MPQSAVGADFDVPLDVHRDFLAQVAFDRAFVLDDLADVVDFVLAQVLNLLVRVDLRLLEKRARARMADAVDVRQRDLGLLLRGRSTPAIRAMILLVCSDVVRV